VVVVDMLRLIFINSIFEHKNTFSVELLIVIGMEQA